MFLVESFLGNFHRHLATFYWSHCSLLTFLWLGFLSCTEDVIFLIISNGSAHWIFGSCRNANKVGCNKEKWPFCNTLVVEVQFAMPYVVIFELKFSDMSVPPWLQIFKCGPCPNQISRRRRLMKRQSRWLNTWEYEWGKWWCIKHKLNWFKNRKKDWVNQRTLP